MKKKLGFFPIPAAVAAATTWLSRALLMERFSRSSATTPRATRYPSQPIRSHTLNSVAGATETKTKEIKKFGGVSSKSGVYGLYGSCVRSVTGNGFTSVKGDIKKMKNTGTANMHEPGV